MAQAAAPACHPFLYRRPLGEVVLTLLNGWKKTQKRHDMNYDTLESRRVCTSVFIRNVLLPRRCRTHSFPCRPWRLSWTTHKACQKAENIGSLSSYRKSLPLRPRHPEHARSRLISEAKQGWAWLVLGWETT
uniref:Uncharacterized protein n=1 Tax=Rousettus aegyptiacus TaxID=9407 RepID=A0A7J8BS71_ROUAE|nr:hypothetical protein HJG63_009649 [Rousettus aegyptiacus]